MSLNPDKVVLDPSMIEKKILESQNYINQANLYDRLAYKSNGLNGNPDKIAVGALEKFIGIYIAVRDSLDERKVLEGSGDFFSREGFLDAYSLYVGAIEGLTYMSKENLFYSSNSQIKKILPTRVDILKQNADYKRRKDLVINTFLTTYSACSMSLTGSYLATYTNDFFEWVIEKTIEYKNSSEGNIDFNDKIKDINIQINGNTFKGFTYELKDLKKEEPQNRSQKKSNITAKKDYNTEEKIIINDSLLKTDNPISDFSLDDIVGNDKLKHQGARAIEYVLSYNQSTKRNVLAEAVRLPRTYCITGPPGTGKTITLKALASYGRSIADEYGLPFKFKQMSSSDFKDEYFSRSVKNLKVILDDMQSGNSSYVLVLEDIDTIFNNRNKKGGEDNSIYGEMLNSLEGVKTSNKGNYIIFSTSNNIANTGNALVQRLKEFVIEANGPITEEDYIKTFKINFGRNNSAVLLSDDDWNIIGKRCLDIKKDKFLVENNYIFTGRDIKNIVTNTTPGIMDFGKPLGWYRLSDDDKMLVMNDNMNNITLNSTKKTIGLLDRFDEYLKSVFNDIITHNKAI